MLMSHTRYANVDLEKQSCPPTSRRRSDWQRQSQPSGWLRSPSPARLPPSPPAIQSVQDAGRPCRSAAPWPTSGVTHIGPVWPNMASKSNLKGVSERSRPFVGAIIRPWRRWIASPPCSAIRPRCHLPLVSRFRSSHHGAAVSFANFGIEGH